MGNSASSCLNPQARSTSPDLRSPEPETACNSDIKNLSISDLVLRPHIQLSSITSFSKLNNNHKRLKNINIVRLNTFYKELIRQDACQELFNNLKRLKTLSSLSLNIAEIKAEDIQKLAKGIRHLNLKSLTLDFWHSFSFNIAKMKAVSQCLVSCSHSLQELKIHFSSSFRPNKDEEMLELASSLNRVKHLKSLTLGLSGCFEASSKGMQALSASLKAQRSLTTLVLDLNGCSKTSWSGLFHLFLTLQHLSQLTVLSLDLGNCYIKPVEVHFLASSIQHMKSLTSLSLSFKLPKRDTASELSNLVLGLPNLKELSTLRLSFSACKTKSAGLLQNLADCLKNSSGLVNLDLDFSLCTELNDKSLHELAAGLKSHKDSLSALSLKLSGCKDLTDKGVQSLHDQIQHMKALSRLSLGLDKCIGVTNKALKILCPRTENNNNMMTKLAVTLNECTNIDDEGIDAFCLGLKSLKQLNSLALSLRGSSVTNKGLLTLLATLKQCRTLMSLDISFILCFKIHFATAEKLFLELPHISYVSIGASGFRGVRDGSVVSGIFKQKKVDNLEGSGECELNGMEEITL